MRPSCRKILVSYRLVRRQIAFALTAPAIPNTFSTEQYFTLYWKETIREACFVLPTSFKGLHGRAH